MVRAKEEARWTFVGQKGQAHYGCSGFRNGLAAAMAIEIRGCITWIGRNHLDTRVSQLGGKFSIFKAAFEAP
jgi:hypothetical protein